MWSSGISTGTTLREEDEEEENDDTSNQVEDLPLLSDADHDVHDDVDQVVHDDVDQVVHDDDHDNDDEDEDDVYTPDETDEGSSRFFVQINDMFTNEEKILFSKFAPKFILTRMENNITVKGGEQMAEVFLTTCGSTIREIYREKLSQFVSSLYLQRKYCSLSEFYVGPIERQVCFGSIEKKFYYVPIIKTIKQLLTDELVSIILEETESSCSEYIRNNNLMNKLRLVLYGDDFTVTNPIGNASKNQKIYAAYLDVDNWPLYKTKAHDIPAVFFVHRNTIDKFDSIDKVLEIAVFDLIKLKVFNYERFFIII